jgi:hypothetical protein
MFSDRTVRAFSAADIPDTCFGGEMYMTTATGAPRIMPKQNCALMLIYERIDDGRNHIKLNRSPQLTELYATISKENVETMKKRFSEQDPWNVQKLQLALERPAEFILH